jgi:hypothetical protein
MAAVMAGSGSWEWLLVETAMVGWAVVGAAETGEDATAGLADTPAFSSFFRCCISSGREARDTSPVKSARKD